MLARQRWGARWPDRTAFKSSVAAVHAAAAREAVRRVPFLSWALSSGFAFPVEALELLCWCESPAEAFLVREFVSRPGVAMHANMAGWDGKLLAVQHPVWNYRVDLAVMRGEYRLAIEVDGLRFHGSQADFARDCLRQRRLTYAGYIVLRFTAKEAMANPVECWRQVDRILDKHGAGKENGPPAHRADRPSPALLSLTG